MGMSDVHVRAAVSQARCATALVVAAALMTALAASRAAALDVLPDEKAGREACERKFCAMVLDRKPTGPDVACDMTKTWDRTKIKKNGEKKAISWGFGDARCKIAFSFDRKDLLPALQEAKFTLRIPPQTIRCEIEDSEKTPRSLLVEAAPKIKFKDGRADKVWINVKDVKGESSMKNLVWAVAKLADGLGIFHKDTVREINKFIHKKCEQEYGASTTKADVGKPADRKAVKAKLD